jgi:hypothetical protein
VNCLGHTRNLSFNGIFIVILVDLNYSKVGK